MFFILMSCLHSMHILCVLYFIHILHSFHMNKERVLALVFHFLLPQCHDDAYCLVPHDRAQLFTYHHRHPSRPTCVLSQLAPGKSADWSLIPLASGRGSFQYRPPWQKEAAPVTVWRTLEQHTRLELIHGACRVNVDYGWLAGIYPSLLAPQLGRNNINAKYDASYHNPENSNR